VDWYALEKEKVLEALRTSREGLSEKRAAERLKSEGTNTITEGSKHTWLSILIRQFTDFLTILLLIATAISIMLKELLDASAMFMIVLLTVGLGFIQEYRAERAIEALQKISSPKANVIRSGIRKTIPASRLVSGDIVILEAGDIVPADLRILESNNLHIAQASLTGESIPDHKRTNPAAPHTPIPDRHSMAFMTTAVTAGDGVGIVVGTGMNSEIGRIASSIQTNTRPKTPLQHKFELMARQMGFAVIGLVVIVFLMGIFSDVVTTGSGENIYVTMIIISLSLIVATVPSSLPAIVTIGLALGARTLAGKRMIVKRLPAAESLGAVTTICSDKTGTLTKNEMTVTRIYVDRTDVAVSGSGYDSHGTFSAERVPHETLDLLLTTAVLCNNAQLTHASTIIGDPTEGALIVAAAKAGITRASLKQRGYSFERELPFDPERKRMSVIVKNRRSRAYVKGAPDLLLERCTHYMSNGRRVRLTSAARTKILERNDAYALDALRVLGFAYRDDPPREDEDSVEQKLTFIGLAGMIDPPRPEVREAIEKCRTAGINVMIITGDHASTACAIAKELGVYDPETDTIITGSELEKMSDTELKHKIKSIRIIARALPIQKLRVVAALQRRDEIVAVTGDGVNDAPALKRADIGIAMGSGTDVAKEVSQSILTDDNFATIVSGIEEGRNIYDKIIKSARFLLRCNFGEVMIIMLALLMRLPLPLLPLQILLINLVTDGLPAFALGFEKPDRDIMKRAPRHPRQQPLTRAGIYIIITYGIFMALGTLLLFHLALRDGQSLAYAQTVAFSTLVFFEMAAVFGSRSLRPLEKLNPLTNPFLLVAIAASILIQLTIVYTPLLQTIFGTVALPAMQWVSIVGVASLGFVFMELSKLLVTD
jgi:P-type Ca2+ transporter type 2C